MMIKLLCFQNASAADEPKVLCIIRDMVDPHANAVKHTMNLPASSLVQMFINDISKQFGYMLGTISVHYERQESSDIVEVVAFKINSSQL